MKVQITGGDLYQVEGPDKVGSRTELIEKLTACKGPIGQELGNPL